MFTIKENTKTPPPPTTATTSTHIREGESLNVASQPSSATYTTSTFQDKYIPKQQQPIPTSAKEGTDYSPQKEDYYSYSNAVLKLRSITELFEPHKVKKPKLLSTTSSTTTTTTIDNNDKKTLQLNSPNSRNTKNEPAYTTTGSASARYIPTLPPLQIPKPSSTSMIGGGPRYHLPLPNSYSTPLSSSSSSLVSPNIPDFNSLNITNNGFLSTSSLTSSGKMMQSRSFSYPTTTNTTSSSIFHYDQNYKFPSNNNNRSRSVSSNGSETSQPTFSDHENNNTTTRKSDVYNRNKQYENNMIAAPSLPQSPPQMMIEPTPLLHDHQEIYQQQQQQPYTMLFSSQNRFDNIDSSSSSSTRHPTNITMMNNAIYDNQLQQYHPYPVDGPNSPDRQTTTTTTTTAKSVNSDFNYSVPGSPTTSTTSLDLNRHNMYTDDINNSAAFSISNVANIPPFNTTTSTTTLTSTSKSNSSRRKDGIGGGGGGGRKVGSSSNRRSNKVCTHCGKAFKTSYLLKSHMLVHTEIVNEKPFQCKLNSTKGGVKCLTRMARKHDLKRHYKSVHKLSEIEAEKLLYDNL